MAGETEPLSDDARPRRRVATEPLSDDAQPRRRVAPLLLLATVPFGGHFFKSALSSLQPLLALSKSEYGFLHSTFALPNATIAPVLGGLIYDLPALRDKALALFAFFALAGGALCAYGLSVGAPTSETLAVARGGGAESSRDGRGDAAATTWIFRGDGSRRCRGYDVDIPWGRVAATPRVPRG